MDHFSKLTDTRSGPNPILALLLEDLLVLHKEHEMHIHPKGQPEYHATLGSILPILCH